MDKLWKGVWHLGSVALVITHLNRHSSVIFEPRSFKFCEVVDIEVIDKFGKKSKRSVAQRSVALVSM